MIYHLCDTKGQRSSALNSRGISIFYQSQPHSNLTVQTRCLTETLQGTFESLVVAEHQCHIVRG